MKEYRKENEQIDELLVGGLKILQSKEAFHYGSDAVFLANFASVRKNEKVLDLCTGGGIIPLLLAAKTNAAYIAGIELQKNVADTAQRSVLLNGLEDRVKIIEGDIKQAAKLTGGISFDVVTCNPPYMKVDHGAKSKQPGYAIARHEIECSMDDVAKAAASVLKFGGRFYVIQKAQRLSDVIASCLAYHLEPKSIRFLHTSSEKNAKLMLLYAMAGAKPGMQVLPPVFLSSMTLA